MSLKNSGIINGEINDVPFQIKSAPKFLSRYILDLIAKYNFINIVLNPARPKIRLSIFIVPNISFPRLKKARLILKGRDNLMVYKEKKYISLTDGLNLLTLPSNRKYGIYFIKNQENLNSALISERFFFLAMFELLYPYGFFYLHAAGVERNKNKIIILANSGGGKSTNALRLFSEGWKYLSDDIVLLKYNNRHQVMATSVTSGLRLERKNPILQKINPVLLKKLSFKETKEEEGYYQTNIAFAVNDRVVKSFIPNIILFPRFSHSKVSMLKPIKKLEVISFMIHHSTSFFLENKIVRLRDNLEIILDLVRQARSFIIEIGNDIQDGSLSLSDMISSLGKTQD